MKWRWHFLITLIVLLIFQLISETITITSIIIPLFWGSLFPDIDSKFQYVREGEKQALQKTIKKFSMPHRNIYTHSIIIPFVVLIFEPSLLVVMMLFAQSLHCLCDINIKKSKQVGFYTIKYLKVFNKIYGMNGRNSTLWLVLQFIGGSIILGVWLYV